MIEQSLLDRFPDNLAAIQDFFQAGRRQAAVRTTSSITFAYNPTTQPINPRLLAEEDRLALAAAEEASRRGFAAEAAMGRLTESLRMGVTPQIIIQEEEEEKPGPRTAGESVRRIGGKGHRPSHSGTALCHVYGASAQALGAELSRIRRSWSARVEIDIARSRLCRTRPL